MNDAMADDQASAAHDLQVAGQRLREHIATDSPPPADFPVQFLLMGMSRLLEEVGRSLSAGHPIDEPVLRVAIDVARHIKHQS